ncbi:MAG: glutamine amidotransferase [Vicinamibacterales bacterium]
MFETLFQLVFKYRPIVFSEGELHFAAGGGVVPALVVAAAALAVTVVSYRSAGPRLTTRDRIVLTGLRAAVLVIALVCLFRPVLAVQAAVPQQNVLALLLDDSRSMQVPDQDGVARGAFVAREFGDPGAAIAGDLSGRFTVRTFRFSSAATRLAPGAPLAFDGGSTRLGAALDAARQELAGLPVAGMVVVSDGADTGEAALGESILALKAAGIPVSTVGVGQPRLARDIQVGRVTTPRTALKGTSLVVDVVLTQTGYDGETVTLDVEDEGRIVGSQAVQFPADGGPATARVHFTAEDAGPRVFRVRVAPRPDELVDGNNAREMLIDVRDRSEKILYFEGEPRFELKFLLRAVAEDENLQVVALQRTADNKYLRLGVDGPDELIEGFPKTRDELFAYRGLILGSIEAGAFTGDQLRMIAEFVERRGGGLIMLGGPRAFAEGGYAGTAVADALPVVLDPGDAREDDPPVTRITVAPTRAGLAQAVTQLAETEAASSERWRTLPPVTTVNRVAGVKPGATVLLTGTGEDRGERPVLAFQRYGRGKAFAFMPQDSWVWQMHASIPVDDLTHEHVWRQMLRWLVDGVPDPVELTATERVDPGGQATITAEVTDAGFVAVNDARVTATITAPDGGETEVPLTWTGEQNGQFRGVFTAAAPGWHGARVEAARGDQVLGSASTFVRAEPGDDEYFDATLHEPVLTRLAEETGGRYYTPATVAGLAEDLRYTARGVTTVEELDLWHMPIVLVLLVGLLCAEWGYRRAVGLV